MPTKKSKQSSVKNRSASLSSTVPRPRPALIARIMRVLTGAIEQMGVPVMEKIADEQTSNPFQVLIGTMLSAQTKDAVTLAASTRLFEVAATPLALSKLSIRRIERLIYPVSFYHDKAKHLKATAAILLRKFSGNVPSNMPELLSLPGVGRKTANLVLTLSYQSLDNICVDTHVHRISNRLGWVCTRNPEETESALYTALQRRWWPFINRYLVTWGQNICKPTYPLCRQCVLADLCPKLGVTRMGK